MTGNSEDQTVKLTITHHRKQEHTHEAFINWIIEDHLQVAIPVFKKYGLISYHLVGIYPIESCSPLSFNCYLVCYATSSEPRLKEGNDRDSTYLGLRRI